MSASRALFANEDGEQAVLSAMLLDDRAVLEAARALRSDDFSRLPHARIFAAMLRLSECGSRVDPVTLSAELDRQGELAAVGGKDFLAQLIDVVPTSANVAHHIRIVREASQRRHLTTLADNVKQAVADGEELHGLAQSLTAKLMPLAVERAGRSFEALRALVGPVLAQIAGREGATARVGLFSGYPEIDDHTAGFRGGELVVLAGAPGSGKTALALNIALNAAKAGQRAAVFSAEATAAQLVERLLNAEARVSSLATRSGNLTNTEGRNIVAAASVLSSLPLHIDETPRPRIGDIIAKARLLKAQHPDLALLVVDYLQLVTPGRTRGRDYNRAEELTDVAYDLQGLGKELGVPIIALSQVDAKAAEVRAEKTKESQSRLSELRWSQGMREAAHFVGLVHRPQADDPNAGSFLDINFAKARDLPPFNARLHWQGAWMRVASLRECTPTLRVVG